MILRLLYRLFLQRFLQGGSETNHPETVPELLKAQRPAQPDLAKVRLQRGWPIALALTLPALIALGWNYHQLQSPLVSAITKPAELRLQIPASPTWPLVVYLRGDALPLPDHASIPLSGKMKSINHSFIPEFQILSAAGVLDIINSDAGPHNTHVFNRGGTIFNVAMPSTGVTVKKTLTNTGVLSVRCDLHPWMKAWIFAPPSRHYSILYEAGSVNFSGLPAGQYVLHMWRPNSAEQFQLVDLSTDLSLTLRL